MARKDAYIDFSNHVYRYAIERELGKKPAELAWLRDSVRRRHHQSVWMAMKEQSGALPDLSALFDAAPEALTW